MKRTFIITLIMAYFIVFTIGTFSFSNQQKGTIGSFDKIMEYKFEFKDENYNSFPGYYDLIGKAAEKYNADILRKTSHYDGEKHISKYTDYIYLSTESHNTGRYAEKLSVDENEFILAIEQNGGFSTQKNEQTRNINLLDRGYNFTLLPFSDLKLSYKVPGTYYVSIVDEKKFDEFINNLVDNLNISPYNEKGHYYTAEDLNPSLNTDFSKNTDVSNAIYDSFEILETIMVFCTVMFIILFLYYLARRTKDISVLRINGVSKNNVIRKLVLKDVTVVSLICIGILVLLGLSISRGNSLYIIQLIQTFLVMYLILIITTYGISVIYINKINLIDSLKGRRPFGIIFGANMIFYFVATFLLVSSGSLLHDNYSSLKFRENRYSEWALMNNYATYHPVLSGDDALEIRSGEYPLDIPSYELYKNLDEQGKILYADASLLTPDYAHNSFDSKIFNVNLEYIKKFGIIQAIENNINIDKKEQASVFLVPAKYKSQEERLQRIFTEDRKGFHDVLHVGLYNYDPMPETKTVKIYYYEDNQDIFTINIDAAPHYDNLVQDPIMMVFTQANVLVPDIKIFNSNPSLFIDLDGRTVEETQQELAPLLKELELDDNLPYLVYPNDIINNQINEIKSAIKMIAISYLLLTVISVFLVIEMVYLLFERNKQLFFVKKSLGKPFINKYAKLLLPVIIINVLVVAAGLKLIFSVNSLNFLSFIILLVEIIIISIIAKVYERRNVSNAIKEGI